MMKQVYNRSAAVINLIVAPIAGFILMGINWAVEKDSPLTIYFYMYATICALNIVYAFFVLLPLANGVGPF